MSNFISLISSKTVKQLSFLVAAAIFTAIMFTLSASAEDDVSVPNLSARSAVLFDFTSNRPLFEKNSKEHLPMASTTKIMTAIIAIENGNIDRTVTVSAKAVGVEGSSVGLKANERITMRDLLYAMLLESANDAAAAIAIEIGGDIPAFAQMMNDKAAEIGLTDTHFENPHGLDGDSHYTTAYDLAKLAAYCMNNPQFAEIVSTRKATVSNGQDGVRWLVNHNKLLRMYDPTIGVKTGFTKKSGRCLVSAAEKDGLRLIAVTLNAPDDWNDHISMLSSGFDSYEFLTLAQTDEITVTVPAVSGTSDCVTVANKVPACISLPKDHGEISCRIELPQFVFAPVESGDILGKAVFECNGQVLTEIPLTACYSVSRSEQKRTFFQKIFNK